MVVPEAAELVDSIEKALASCRAFILVIGPRWVNAVDANGHRRLDDPEDYVLLEVVTALKAGVRVIPALVDGAKMPKAEELPPAIAAITNATPTNRMRCANPPS